MKWLIGFGVLLAIALLAAAIAMRSVGHDPALWHVDPNVVTEIESGNQFLLNGPDAVRIFTPPARTAQVFHEQVAQPYGARLLAGSPDEGWMTYVVTSRIFAFPDYVSVRITPDDRGARLSIYSRSRFGQSDLGANRKRVERWVAALKAHLAQST